MMLLKHMLRLKKNIKKPTPVFINSDLRKAIHKKHFLWNKYQNGKVTWNLYRVQRNLVTALRRKSSQIYFKERCNGGSKNQNFWQTIKPLIGDK